MPHGWEHTVLHATHDKDSKVAAIVLIVMGLFFTPFLIGIPIMLLGFYRLCK